MPKCLCGSCEAERQGRLTEHLRHIVAEEHGRRYGLDWWEIFDRMGWDICDG